MELYNICIISFSTLCRVGEIKEVKKVIQMNMNRFEY